MPIICNFIIEKNLKKIFVVINKFSSVLAFKYLGREDYKEIIYKQNLTQFKKK